MLEHIKTQVVNPQIPKKGLYLHINFDKLALTQGNSYSELAKWKALKNAVINKKKTQKTKNKQCFKWAARDTQCVSKVHHYGQCN